jgi:hypothetical protein
MKNQGIAFIISGQDLWWVNAEDGTESPESERDGKLFHCCMKLRPFTQNIAPCRLTAELRIIL